MWVRKQSVERFLQSIIFTLHRVEDVSRQLCNAGRKWTIYTESFFSSSVHKNKNPTAYNLFGGILVINGPLEHFTNFSPFIGLKNDLHVLWAKINRNRVNEIIIYSLGVLPGEPVMTLVSKPTYTWLYLSSQKFVCCDTQRPPVNRKGVARVGALKGLKKLRSWETENMLHCVYSNLRNTLYTE